MDKRTSHKPAPLRGAAHSASTVSDSSAQGEAVVASEASGKTSPHGWTWWLCAAALIVAPSLAYSNTFEAPFVFDDIPWIQDNPIIRQPVTSWAQFGGRPLPLFTFALHYAVHQNDVRGYHLVNLGIHLLATLVLFDLVRRTLLLPSLAPHYDQGATLLAFSIALIWALHPLQTQAVTYIVQRMESMMGLAYLASLWCLVRWREREPSGLWLAASAAMVAVGLGCKEVMLLAPLTILWFDRAFIALDWNELWRARGLYYGVLAAMCGGHMAWLISRSEEIATSGVGRTENFTPWTYLLTQAGVLCHYLRLSFWPAGQCFDYGWPVTPSLAEAAPYGVVIVALLGLTAWLIFVHPPLSFLGGWFFLVLAPTSTVLPIADAAVEHRMYLPLASLAVLMVMASWHATTWLLASRSLSQRASILLLFIALLGLCLGTTSYLRNQVYESQITIWADVLAKAPHNPRGWLNYAGALQKQNTPASDQQAIRCLERAQQLDFVAAHQWHYNMGIGESLWNLGRPREAIAKLREAIAQAGPAGKAKGYQALGLAYAALGETDEAVGSLCMAIDLAPLEHQAYLNLALTVAPTNQAGAQKHLDVAIFLAPHLESEMRVAFAQVLSRASATPGASTITPEWRTPQARPDR